MAEGRILTSPAHARVERRLLVARGSVYAMFDGFSLGWTHEDVLRWVEGMLQWACGGKSHWNMILGVSEGDRGEAVALTAQADAAEAQKWAAVYVALSQEAGRG